jgi:predicted ATP-grasp superfamily ATP-dependent carboligase
VGIPTPWFVAVDGSAEPDEDLARVTFPCLVKPCISHEFVAALAERGIDAKLLVAESRADLDAALHLAATAHLDVLVTELVPGPDDLLFSYTSYLDESGEPLLGFLKRKVRSYPPGRGTGSYHVSTHDAEIEALGERFFRGIGLRGLAYVEFKRDARTGEPKLIECNHRLGAANELPRHAGIDLASFVYDRLTGRPVEPQFAYRTGTRVWHPADDVRAFAEMRRKGELSLLGWLRSLLHPLHFAMFSWSDPRPSLAYHRRALRRRFRRSGQETARVP